MNKFKIAIKFGDNDFHSTFKGVLSMLFDAFKYDKLPNNKEKLCWIINQLSPIAYITHQNQWEYNGLEEAEYLKTEENKEFLLTKKYLQITPENILLNKEVDTFIKEGDKVHFFNGDVFILDTTLYSNNIYSL